LRPSKYSTPQKEIDAVIEFDANNERFLKQIAVSPSGVDCTDLKGSDYLAARFLVEHGLVIVHPTGWNGPRFLATANGRKAREFEREGIGMSPKKLEPESMSLDELWLLYGEISAILSARIRAEKHESPKKLELESMSLDELWLLHGEISAILSARIKAEKHQLEKRLAVLSSRIAKGASACWRDVPD
jgi:hypothetical protein